MQKILTVVGARPQFIKAAAVSRRLREVGIEEVLVHTGQHFDKNMSEVFFNEMEIPKPHYNLDIHSLSHGAMTGRMMEHIETVLLKERPDGVMVFGDTNSTLAGALAARKLHIPVVHVEAGLRSFNMDMPEEINRILTDRISNVLFCPTDAALANLKLEGYDHFNIKIEKNGDVMQDAALYYSERAAQLSNIIQRLELKGKPFVLATVHRQENTDNPELLHSLIGALNKINREITVVAPLHPRTLGMTAKERIKPEFEVIEPVGYFDMVELLKACSLVMTDSGGVQKEAFFFGKNCVTLREQTEWVELVEGGYNMLAGANDELIYKGFKEMMLRKNDFSVNLYGKGKAALKVAQTLLAWTA
ncbi:MAG TPA: UDP-N-acetylglucosamine 2-epimerase (non-hydrolyzing) [Williamwhitmania sp.]|nr:UDP-N-acetylglucosamine 2-epimerase (non-hydrolyzing) [Williamwhitmania sp.]